MRRETGQGYYWRPGELLPGLCAGVRDRAQVGALISVRLAIEDFVRDNRPD